MPGWVDHVLWWQLEQFVPQTFLGNHDVTRIASQIGDPRHIGHAYAVLLTVGGTPSIYYGDEMGYTGVKEQRAGGDDQVRPVMPGTPSELALGHEVFATVHELVGLRRRHPWLHRGRTRDLMLTNPGYAFEVCGDGAAERIVVCLNIDEEALSLAGLGATRVLAGNANVGKDARATLAPHSWAVLG